MPPLATTVTALHAVYGLRLQVNVPIPGLAASAAGPGAAVHVRLGSLPAWLDEEMMAARVWRTGLSRNELGEPGLIVWKLAGGRYFRLRYADGTEFVIDQAGTEVWAAWPDDLTLEDTATYLLGPVLGFVLLLRGTVSLHASAIAVDGRAIALIGPAGAGKSTTAAAFASRGYPVVSEDVLALDDRCGAFLVRPGCPRLRLWPEAVSVLYGSPDALPRLTPTWDKRRLDLRERGYHFQAEPLPLAAAYLLDERADDPAAPFVAGLPAHTAMKLTLAHTYVAYLIHERMRARHFDLLGRLASAIPFRRVTPHADPAFLPALCDMILSDFRQLPRPASGRAPLADWGCHDV